ncbi:DUF348 domain-containing protein [Candidatus Saccharibacteria bacterium]|nr:DUF348 domain-containing protein [Candidatus Saccharibacteria bacterium]
MNILSVQMQTKTMSRIGFFLAIFVSTLTFAGVALAETDEQTSSHGQHIITIYDQGEKRVVLTKASDVKQTLEQADVRLETHDRVEPALATQFVASEYTINIYRAYPVVIVDGLKREQVLTPYGSARDIVKDANMKVRDEDMLTLEHSTNILADGAGTRLTITRAMPVTLVLYGAPTQVYTQARTVAELLSEKNITLESQDTVSVASTTAIRDNMTIEIWRDGVQAVTIEESIAFPVRTVLDADRPVGFREVQTPGVPGKKQVVYEVTRQNGQEVSRKVLQDVLVTQPQEQVELVGNKTTNSLTKSKGAQQFTDSRGVAHRETYYDLPMNVVMSACGGGDYTIRADGAKIDKDGYILIAANLGNYPRCSIVETSMGLGRVYDTGGFAVKHPHGFDLATDWTNGDGR